MQPSADCDLCPRLAAFRGQNQQQFPRYFNNPVPSFGSLDARLLIVGLAPGLHGANQSGRPFTGDYAGDVLYPALLKHGFASGQFAARADDGLLLKDCRISNAVRCVPPANKPLPTEIKTCRPFLQQEMAAMPDLQVILALGGIAHASVLASLKHSLGQKVAAFPFGHGTQYPIGGITLLSSYHTSRYNMNTGRLSRAMFDEIIATCRLLVAKPHIAC